MTTTPAPGSLEAECPGGLGWAWYGLGECVRTTRDKVSIAFGVMSIAAWFLFGLPQIIENCKSKIPDAALSVFLLGFWLLGDSLNFVGAFLTNQLFLQKLLAGYTVVVDIVLCVQYGYYLWLHKRRMKHEMVIEEGMSDGFDKEESKVESAKASTKGKVLASVLLGFMALSFLPEQMLKDNSFSPIPSGQVQRHLFQATTTTANPWDDFLSSPSEKVGYVFGWTSAAMYACGRLHQIYINWKRKCTDGLSFYLFFLAVMGNTFYSCQIFIKSTETVYLVKSLPWIIGSLGILAFDAAILIQFLLYRNNHVENDEDDFDFVSDDGESSPNRS